MSVKQVVLYTLLMRFLEVYSYTLTDNSNNGILKLEKSSTGRITWTITPDKDERLIDLEITIQGTSKIVIFTKQFLLNPLNTFAINRINVIPPKYNKYEIRIINVNYSDVATLHTKVVYLVPAGKELYSQKVITLDTKIDVLGEPELCGMNLPPILNINTTEVNVTICGNPKPQVKWTVNNREVKGGLSSTVPQKMFTYRYSLSLKNLKEEHCGMKLQYNAIGYKSPLIGSTLPQVQFVPSRVDITEAVIDGICLYVQWIKLNTGNCNIFYKLYLLSSQAEILFNVTLNTTVYNLCSNKTEIIKIIAVQAVYESREGLKTQLTVLPKKDDSNSYKLYIIVGAAAGGGSLVLLLCIIVIVIVIRRNKKAKPQQNGNTPTVETNGTTGLTSTDDESEQL